MTTFPLSTLAPTIDATGISAPPYADIYESLQASIASIYGSDIYIEDDSQDGQMLAIFAEAQDDTNGGIIATYNSFRPGFAQGAGLASVVKINGLEKQVPTNSQADVTIGGTAGTTINNGIVGDANSNQWLLPAQVIIDNTGAVIVTATCTTDGAIAAAPGSINVIVTPTAGWQSASNSAAAAPGAPVESDAALRVRQTVSTALPALSIIEGIEGALANIAGVIQLKIFENDTNTNDTNGLPPHSIAVVIEGGDATAIAQTIRLKKDPGTSTYGMTSILVEDAKGVPSVINFFLPNQVEISVTINIKALAGYTSSIGALIVTQAVNFINGEGINANEGLLSLSALSGACYNTGFSTTYNIISMQISRSPATPLPADLVIAFNEIPFATAADITLNVS